MYNLKLVWWVFWRGLVYGLIEGTLFGTVVGLFTGTYYGAIFGAGLGIALGLLNGISLMNMTGFFFYPPRNRTRYITCIRILAVPIDVVVVFAFSASLLGYIGIIPALMAGITAFALSPHFADFATVQLSRNMPTELLSRIEN